jgi:hypothetical protein
MGRKLKYFTEEERRANHNKQSLAYYYRNLEKCRKKRMERYEKIDHK